MKDINKVEAGISPGLYILKKTQTTVIYEKNIFSIDLCQQNKETNLSLVDEYFMWCSSFLSGVCVKILTIPSTSPMALCLSKRGKAKTKFSYFLLKKKAALVHC